MPKNPVFDQARGKATPELVESLFSGPGARWDNDEYWTLNPTRNDSSVGSFSINGQTGAWYDNATGEGGDLIKLMVDSGRAPTKTKAAEMIVKALGGVLPDGASAPARSHLDRKPGERPEKVKAVIPFEDNEETKAALNRRILGDWARENRGRAVKGWTWMQLDGKPWCRTVRYEKPKLTEDGTPVLDGRGTPLVDKDVIAHYYGVDGKWHEGNPMATGRHLYRADQIAKADAGTRFLIVEGEKKAEVKFRDRLAVTWIGGALAWSKSDWAPLERAAAEGRVLIWPDADAQNDKTGKLLPWPEQPGMKAAIGIARRLPGAKIMDVSAMASVKSGWDAADAVAEGKDVDAFIDACPLYAMDGPPSKDDPPQGSPRRDNLPFICLGYDKAGFYFMRKDVRVVFSIGMGSFNGSKAQTIADLSFWMSLNMTTTEGGVRVPMAQDYLQTLEHDQGLYDPKKIRGAGVWRDAEGIILNDGRRIVSMDGKSATYDAYQSAFFYVPSKVTFGEMHGATSTDEDGQQLERLFRAQEFEEPSMAIVLMGWCLISPFGGALKWRPHVWVTGRKGTGKSWLWENLIVPLCGPFAYKGSAKDTEAGIRWSLDQDARPALFGEMEPKSKGAQAKIASILELARNASDDSASDITISQAGGGTKSFSIRSMMAFTSTMIPTEDAATTSRITRVELRAVPDQSKKFAKSAQYLGDLMDDPGRFTRRIFQALPRIIADIEWIRSTHIAAFRSQRAADQLAPMLAAAWAVQSDVSVRESGDWLVRWVSELAQESKVVEDDEDTFMRHLLESHLRTDKNATRTVAELLGSVERDDDQSRTDAALLERYGISLRRKYLTSPWLLFISTASPKIAGLFKDTPYEQGYGAQVRRHKLASGGVGVSVRMASGKPRCQCFEWDKFKALYLDDTEEPVPERVVYDTEDEDDEGAPF